MHVGSTPEARPAASREQLAHPLKRASCGKIVPFSLIAKRSCIIRGAACAANEIQQTPASLAEAVLQLLMESDVEGLIGFGC